MVKLSKVLEGDHFEAFYENLGPIDDDLASQIVEYSNIKFEGDHMAKHNREILKIIDNLKRK